MAASRFDPSHFIEAQDSVYEQVLSQLRLGRKTTHWMWFIFPQIEGLGSSEMARRFAIASVAEASAYARHERLGARLLECTRLTLTHRTATAEAIFGGIDAMKFHASMTLFAASVPDEPVFAEALERYFAGEAHGATRAEVGKPRGVSP